MAAKMYDLIVIGGGSGGVRASRIAASHGANVALVEGRHLGGTCVNVGCVPKKLYAYSAGFRQDALDAAGYGWSGGLVDHDLSHDWQKLAEHKDKEINRLQGIYKSLLKDLDLYEGYGRFVNDREVEVNGRRLHGDKILIATGRRSQIPDIPGADLFVDSDRMFELKKRPQHIVIYGGGYIAVEFAGILRGHGSDVTLVYRGPNILKNFDTDMREHLVEEMTKKGVRLCLNQTIDALKKAGPETIEVSLSGGEVLEADIALAATGRVANFEGLDLAKSGVEPQANGLLSVNEDYATNVPHIYALGDIISDYQLTPLAIAEAHYLADKLFAPPGHVAKPRPHYDVIPTAIFSDPPIGTAGLSEAQAIEQYGEDSILCYRSKFRPLKYTLAVGEGGRDEKVLMKLVVHKDNERVLGIHMCGHDAPEIVQGFALAVDMGATKADFDRLIGIHPTSGEEYLTMR